MRDHARNYGFNTNKELMLYLKDSGYIRSNFIFDIMCSVDRINFTTNRCTAYHDRPEPVAYEKTISAPHMHAEVLEQMSHNLRNGKCALDIGSGSGYLTTCMALALGEKGKVIGVDCIPGFQNMANQITQTHFPELLQSSRVEYIVYDGRRGWPWGGPYDAIHVGVASETIPETLIEQLAPGGSLVMPVGLNEQQVLVVLKKSLNGNIEKKELMKVRYGTFTDVNLPWSSMVGNGSIMNQVIKNANTFVPKSKTSGTPANELFKKEIIKKSLEPSQLDTKAKTLENIVKQINNSETNEDTNLNKSIKKLQCSLPRNIEYNTNERKTVLENTRIFEKKDYDNPKSKAQEGITETKFTPKTALIGDSDKITLSLHTKADSFHEKLKIIQPAEGPNDANHLDFKPLQENTNVYKSVLELECTNPKTMDSNKNSETLNEKSSDNVEKSVDSLERNICYFKSPKRQDIESPSEDSDEVSSVDTEIDAQAFYKDCENSGKISGNIQSNYEVHSSKSFSKSLENFSTIKEPVSNLRTSISTYIQSDKNKTKTIREKIEIFEKNIENCKTVTSQENMVTKITPILKENSNTNNPSNPTSKSEENLVKSNDPESLQSSYTTILKCNKAEPAQQEIDIVEENAEKSHNNIEQELYVPENEKNLNSEENVEKIEEEGTSSKSIYLEFRLFKDEIKVILENFLSHEKENNEEIKLRQVNVHIDSIHQLQLVKNHDEQEKGNSQNFERYEKSYGIIENDVANKKLHTEKQDANSDDLHVQVRNISEKVEQLQAQYDNNIEKLIATNEELKRRAFYYENLEKRVHNLEDRFKLMTRIIAKLIDKTNCHEKVLNMQLAITEKEEVSRIFEKSKRVQTEDKIDNLITALSRIGQEIQLAECNFVDNVSKNKDEFYVKESDPTSNTYDSNSETFLSEIDVIKTLLHSGKENSTGENKLTLNNESESTNNENEIELLKIILEEQ